MTKTLLALTTTSCRKCPEIKEYIHKTELPVDEVVIMDENHKYFTTNCEHYGATQAPTVILIEDGEEVGRAHDVEELKE